MRKKVSNYIADFLVDKGVEHVFTVTGGGAMHLNDAFGHHLNLTCIYNHHEQASAIAAEGYARLTGKIAAICVTSGPGGTNAITGVVGGWLDSIPMFIVSGQVKRETTLWATDVLLRQLGDQEFNIVNSVHNMTKYAVMITEPSEIRYHLERAWYLANSGRKGPVWIDVPLDVQATIVETDELRGFCESELYEVENPRYDSSFSEKIINQLSVSKRPVILAGSGINLAKANKEFIQLIEKLQIPVVTAWNAHDTLWDEHPLYCGRPGTVGTRGGNFIVQNSDLLIVLGCRLNIRQVSYNYKMFAPKAYKIIVDIDKNELKKPTIHADLPIWANVKDVMNDLLKFNYNVCEEHQDWLKWCRKINARFPAAIDKHFESTDSVNPYAFIDRFSDELSSDDVVVCGNGSACVVTFQAFKVKQGQRLFTNSGCAAMGYGFPAAIGTSVARKGERVICIDGDGSFQMNLQELQTVVYNKLNVKIIYLNNNGYHSIRQTQSNLFKGQALVGVSSSNGISFPNMQKIIPAYGISYFQINNLMELSEKIKQMFAIEGPAFCEVILDPHQNFEPKLSSKVLPDGKIVSPEIDDMFPFISREEYESIKKVKKELVQAKCDDIATDVNELKRILTKYC